MYLWYMHLLVYSQNILGGITRNSGKSNWIDSQDNFYCLFFYTLEFWIMQTYFIFINKNNIDLRYIYIYLNKIENSASG